MQLGLSLAYPQQFPQSWGSDSFNIRNLDPYRSSSPTLGNKTNDDKSLPFGAGAGAVAVHH